MSTAKNAILKAKIEGIIYEIMVKTTAANVYVDDTTTLAAKLATLVADIAAKASTEEMNAALALKAEKTHSHAMSEVTDLETTIAALATTEAMNAAIEALKQEMLGDTPVEAYNTFTELAEYIAEHQEASDALTAAIGQKADLSAFNELKGRVDALGALASKSVVSESDLDAALAEKVNAAAEGNHSHANKTVLDGITAQNVTDWNDAVVKEHEHANKAILDDISSTKVAAWDAAEGNAKTYAEEKASAAETAAKTYADGLNTAMDGRVAAVEGKAHEHANKTVLDGITADKVSSWDGKARVIYSASEPADLTDKDLWVQLV